MPKQGVDFSFAQGLDTKTDPKRVPMGKFQALTNSIFQKGGLLQKRNGYGSLPSLPDSTYSYLTTFNGDLTAIGPSIAALNAPNSTWVTKGFIEPLSLSTLPLLRNNLTQSSCSSAVSPNGLVCTVYVENNNGTLTNKYVVADVATGQNIIPPTPIPPGTGAVVGGMQVATLGNYFIILFRNDISGVSHLQYFAINFYNVSVVTTPVDVSGNFVPSTNPSFDCYTVNGTMYIAYNTTTPTQEVAIKRLTSTLVLSVSPTTFTGYEGTIISLTTDPTTVANPVIYVSFYSKNTDTGYTAAINSLGAVIMAPVEIIASGSYLNLTSTALNGICIVYAEMSNAYSWDSSVPTNYIQTCTITLATSTASSLTVMIRSVGLASKAFLIGTTAYFLAAYQSSYQPTYFLIDATRCTAANPVIAAKLAYENGGGYVTTGLSNVSISGDTVYISYLYKDLITSVSKETAVPAGTQVAGIYSQTGVNLVTFVIGTQSLDTAEIGQNLHISGGFLSMYDGYLPVEHNFFLWPDTDQTNPADTAVWSTTGGNIHAQPDGATNTNAYWVQFTYEWTDNQGNAFRSAPSIPIAITTTGSGTTGSITYNVPTLRLTMKTANPVKICAYRWSVANQIYYQTTSIISPTLNITTADSVQIVDTNDDSTILGNNILYTTGGVVEDVNAPASNVMSLFDTRLWLVDAEDPNLLWFSKQVIEATPVEMSDLFTVYIPPTTSTEGSTGPITALAAMDDKLVIFKENAILYINGSGPDNTGASNQYSQPVFITATVGCTNQQSIVLTPTGLMFQSNKGIWLLDRGMNTSYIGAPVENFNSSTVNSAVNVPATNQVRFTLNTGTTLMYDYYYGQWGTFTGVPAISSCIYQGLHSFINSFGAVYQETSGSYIDGSNPVLMSFTTGPLRLGDLQNYQRAFFFYLLGTYISPHKLQLSMSYDYETAPSHSVLISPTNYSTPYGSGSSQSPYGQGDPYGGGTSLYDWRIFLDRQRCMAFAITLQEVFDASLGVAPGAGLTLSGMNVVMGFKSSFRPQSAAHSVG